MSNPTTTVIIQERRRLVRSGLAEILATQDGLTVLASVANDDEVLAGVRSQRPDVVLLELEPPWDLRALVAELRAAHAAIRIVAMHRGRLSDLGRRPVDAQIDALAAYGGGTAAIIAAIMAELVEPADRTERRHLPSRATLTPREREVLRHLADGMTAADCAAALSVSPKTVDNHKQRIFSKLGVQNQAHAVALAHRIGLLGGPTIEKTASG